MRLRRVKLLDLPSPCPTSFARVIAYAWLSGKCSNAGLEAGGQTS